MTEKLIATVHEELLGDLVNYITNTTDYGEELNGARVFLAGVALIQDAMRLCGKTESQMMFEIADCLFAFGAKIDPTMKWNVFQLVIAQIGDEKTGKLYCDPKYLVEVDTNWLTLIQHIVAEELKGRANEPA